MRKLIILLALAVIFAVAQAGADPAPQPTPLEPFYPEFDYDTGIHDPESCMREWYTLNGRVVSYHEFEDQDEEGIYNSQIYLDLDGDKDLGVIVVHQRKDGEPQPKYGDRISCYGQYYKLAEQPLAIGGYRLIPMFGTFYVVIL